MAVNVKDSSTIAANLGAADAQLWSAVVSIVERDGHLDAHQQVGAAQAQDHVVARRPHAGKPEQYKQ